ncbi:DUF29 family protein [Okeanomitos corallinicola TIOX110]|uniref:DUF29 family protein n=1 Tax=Okeanomitos corallinicola TIOX110 TaxID=3133117 RepID=A0ABZ2US48_9CYAN
MTQELRDLRNSILQGLYTDALVIVDELEGMSKQAIIGNIQSYVKILIIHLIKNQIEKCLTNSWAASIRNSIREVKKINIKENKKSYYINQDKWEHFIEEEVIEDAIADASLEVMNGVYNQFELADLIDRKKLITTTIKYLYLTYFYSAKELPTVVAETLTQLPGGEDWKTGKR